MKHVTPWKVIIVVTIMLIIAMIQPYIVNKDNVEMDPWENLPPNKSSIEVMIENGYEIE